MKELQKTLFYAFFSIEIILFIFFYMYGPQGKQALQYLEEENKKLCQENECIKTEILQLENKYGTDQYSSFYKEKIARERLQMARPDDIIYYVDT